MYDYEHSNIKLVEHQASKEALAVRHGAAVAIAQRLYMELSQGSIVDLGKLAIVAKGAWDNR